MNDLSKQRTYEAAKKRVEQEKGFYTHLTVFIVVNILLLFINSDFTDQGFQNWLDWNLYITPLLWGIGLFFHGLKTFNRNFIFSKDWEDRKIKKLMEDENF